MFVLAEAWKAAYPDAHAGILAMNAVDNPPSHPELEHRKKTLEGELRSRYAGQGRRTLETIPTLAAYNSYYKKFKKTYHVQAQLESIAFKDRSIPSVAALVEAMFMAEIKNLLLTAGHDLDQLQLPVTLSIAGGDERYTLLRGQEQILKAGDMLISDQVGVISSIIYGPDLRTQITPATRNVLFTVYAPPGVSPQAVEAHLQDIRDYVLIVSPGGNVQRLQVFGARS
jgi:DNA/RNA-binding domain of Phe-tRNA-synthetase-like protein